MESPDRKDNILPTVDQGSPFFKYLCNLSPIKSSRPCHVVQTYAELSMPPPPAIFTSPANPSKGGTRARRGLGVSNFVSHSWGVDKENLPNHPFVARSFTSVQAETGHTTSHEAVAYVSASVKPESGDKHEDTSKSLDFGDVSEYLTEPVDPALYSAPKTSFLMVKTATIREEFQYQPGDEVHMSSQDEPTSSQPSVVEENSHEGPGNKVATQASQDSGTQPGDVCSQRSSDALSSRPNTDQRNGDDIQVRNNVDALQLDQDTAAMAYLLVGDAENDGAPAADWSSGQQPSLTDFAHKSPDFSAVERISDVANLRIRDELEVAASNSLVNDALTVADLREVTEDDRRNVLVSNSLSHRGVRRRCLDFETARRKSMGGGVPRKTSGSRSKTAGGPSELPSTSCVPPSVLYERAAASSDATNSSCAAALCGESHASTPRQPRSNSNVTSVKSPGLLKLTSIQRATSDKMVVETTRTVIESSCRTGPFGIGLHLNSLHLNSGLHLNSLTGSISFSPQNKEVSRSLQSTAAPDVAVASLLRIPELSRNPNELSCDSFTSVGSGSNCFTMNSSASLYGSTVSVPFVDKNLTRDVTPAIEMAKESSKGNDIHSSIGGSRQSLDGYRSTGPETLEKRTCPTGKKRFLHHDVQPVNLDFTEEFESPRSPKKKRKSLVSDKSGEGCKRCNCKKSKCLKLYCECFAAGTYCVGSCTCQDCFNKPEHEETVLQTRQQIESRNPLAFAPKIIHAGDSSPKRGEEIIDTPASARHKRGCNCKKSLCLKKYCECYQAGVGCSEGCRCEGCKNMYGRKEANEEADEKDILLEALEKESQEGRDELPKPGSQEGGVGLDQQRHMGKDLSPITPSVEYTGQGRTMGRTRSASKKRPPSPWQQRASPRSLRNCAEDPLSPMNVCPDSTFAAQQDPEFQLSKIERSPNTTPKFTRMTQLSPRWERLGDICTLTPLPQAPLRPTPASISTLERSGASPCFNRQGMETVSSYKSDFVDFTSLVKPSSFQLPPDDSSPSPSNRRCSTSHQTPCTPFTGKDDMKFDDNRSAQFGGYSQDDDDTPAFLRYSDVAMSPMITKNGSPKQKRVSPPQFEGHRDRVRGDGRNIFDARLPRPSPGLRSSRKFILTSISGVNSSGSSMGPTVQGHIGSSQKKGTMVFTSLPGVVPLRAQKATTERLWRPDRWSHESSYRYLTAGASHLKQDLSL
ncbi:hypothetical protein R1flu_011334 [Riccia fluitans]|uniref:CRC domain-containing protein n=1 Tax=Riccia fluitans TaxID=41844 RepID=A0ABD1ZAQ7_9MARC